MQSKIKEGLDSAYDKSLFSPLGPDVLKRIEAELISHALKEIEEMQIRNRNKNMATTNKKASKSQAPKKQNLIEVAGVRISNPYLEQIVREIRQLRNESDEAMNPETSAYERGYYNAVENILAKFEGRNPVFVPTKPVSQQNKWEHENMVVSAADANRGLSAEGVVDNFMNGIAEREPEYPEILSKITDRILWKLSHDAEVLQERTVTAKSRLEDALKVLARGGSKKS